MTSPRITIEVDLSRAGLLELRAALDTLLGDLADSTSKTDEPDRMLQADRKVGEVWGRVGENIKRFLALGAQLNEAHDAEFSMEDIAQGLRTPVKTVRSWHRNLGRTLRQVEDAIPEPPFMIGRWDGERQQYRFPREIRAAILDRHARSGAPASLVLDAELRSIERQTDRMPVVAIRDAAALLERELRQKVADLDTELPDDNPDIHAMIKIAHHGGMITKDTGNVLRDLVKQRDRIAHDRSGTEATPDQARDFLTAARSLLFTLGTAESTAA
jgi:hypothetical protein